MEKSGAATDCFVCLVAYRRLVDPFSIGGAELDGDYHLRGFHRD